MFVRVMFRYVVAFRLYTHPNRVLHISRNQGLLSARIYQINIDEFVQTFAEHGKRAAQNVGPTAGTVTTVNESTVDHRTR